MDLVKFETTNDPSCTKIPPQQDQDLKNAKLLFGISDFLSLS